jgi:hypothetical protein
MKGRNMNASVVFLGNLALTVLFATLMLAEYFREDLPFQPAAHGQTRQKSLWFKLLKAGAILAIAGACLALAVLTLI